MRVLIIEDDPASRDLATRILAGIGHSVVTAANGLEGIRLAHEQRPDLVLLDLHLPDVPGWIVAAQLRADDAFRTTPIIAVSAGTSDDRANALGAGCSDFLAKPYAPAALRATVDLHLPSSERTSDPLDRERTTSG